VNRNLFAGSAVVVLLCAMVCAAADDAMVGTGPLGVRGWRNDWTGRYPDAKPVTAWDIQKKINILWRLPTSRFGNAMPLVIGDRVCFTVDPSVLVCLDKMTGKVLWTSLGAEPAAYAGLFTVDAKKEPWSERNLNYGANAGSTFPTPVTDGKRIWYRSGGQVFCHDLADGKRLWQTNTHQGGGGHFANIASLLLVRNILVCHGGGSDYWLEHSTNKVPDGAFPENPQTGKFSQWVVGMDAESGKILWDVGPLNAGGYGATGTPVPVIVNDGKQQRVFVLTPEGHAIRPEDGKLINPFVGARSGCGTPIPLGNRVLFHSALLEFSMNGPDKLVARKVCAITAPGNLGGPAYNNGMVYSGYRPSGKATRVEAATTDEAEPTGSRLYGVCEAATGRVVHMGVRGPRIADTPEWPTPAVAGKYLFFATLTSVDVADISLGRPWPVAMNVNERSHTGPVFDGERMYLRTYDAITCIARKGEDGARYEREVNARTVIKAFPGEIGKRAVTELRPVEDANAWVGGPASMYTPGEGPDQWVFAGPFPKADGKDALESLGGCAKAQPAAGKQVTFEGTTCTFAAVDPRHITPKGLDTDGPTGKDRKGQSFFFAWLIVGKAEYVTWNPRRPGVRLWVGGREVLEDQLLKLDKGAYPVLMRIALPEDFLEGPGMVVNTAFAASEDPAETRKKDIALVREGRNYLKLVVEVLPGTDEARQAATLLKAID
jgi:outer membrane protein assembly factor BamB